VSAERPLIPRSVLFGNPDRATPTISPDGNRLAFLAPRDGVLNVWVAPADDPAAAEAVTDDTDRGIRIYSWTYTGRHLIYIQDKNGDENWHVYAVDVESKETRDLTPIDGVHAQLQHVSPEHPDEILVGLNDRDPSLHDIYRVRIADGERTLVIQNEGMAAFVTDDQYRVRLAMRMTPDGGSEVLRPAGGTVRPAGGTAGPADGTRGGTVDPAEGTAGGTGESQGAEAWEPYFVIAPEDLLTTSVVDFDKSGRKLYLLDSRGRDTAALYGIEMPPDDPAQAGVAERELLCESHKADIDGVIRHPTEKTIQAASYTFERKEWVVLDRAIEDDLRYLKGVCPGELEILSRSLDDARWTVAFVADNAPVYYYRYDRAHRSAAYLFSNNDELARQPLVPMFTAVVPARDGLELVTYVTLPGASARGDDRSSIPVPEHPLPTVLLVHGGPWGRDTWGYNRQHQWLANRGYAVISVNFRASTGFGKAFANAGDKEWGAAMHNDLLDTVDWAVRKGIADPDRVAIMGGSYGGYATLVGLTFTPEKFACGVDIVGPSNLITLLESVPEYWKPTLDLLTTRVGDHRTPGGRRLLEERSPLNKADRIMRPLIIAQGANDPRVKQAESDQIVEAMTSKGIPVTYVLYPDEGHGFARPENRISFFAVAEAFLARCLGGRYEEIGSDFEGSSIQVVTGASEVPGLSPE